MVREEVVEVVEFKEEVVVKDYYRGVVKDFYRGRGRGYGG